MKIKICAAGDMMLLERLPAGYPFHAVKDLIAQNDIRLTNLETVLSDWDCFASSFCGGQWINTEPATMDDIEKFGFNLYSCANNHSMDFSFDGLLSTKRELEKRNITFAGIGRDLPESASAAIYTDPETGHKTALISATSTFIDAARAGAPRGEIPGRPGVNPLRINTKYLVTREHFEQLHEIAKCTYINGERDNARAIGSLPPEEKDSINFGGQFFCVSENGTEGKFTYCNANDLARITGEVAKAKQMADHVIVAVHSHQIRHAAYYEPDYFQEEFAHACIDAGADIIVGGGTHQLKPIEIYHGRPIFYSLGNFVFQNDKVKKLPADFWDKYHYPVELSVREGMAIKTKNGTVGLELDKMNYLSVMPLIEFSGDRLTKIELVPISLGFEKEAQLKGLPYIANEEDSDFICRHLAKISEEYHTKFKKGKFIEIANL